MTRRVNSRGMSGHHRPNRGATDTWLTPPELIRALGPFDLDPCCPPVMPWATAKRSYALPHQDGLTLPWSGRVWLNPPYGPEVGRWLDRLAGHGNGIALIFARTETEQFHRCVWERADACLFLKGRLHYHHPDGTRAPFNAGAPSVLVAYGPANRETLQRCQLPGAFVVCWPRTKPTPRIPYGL
ncbi:DNA N-6-adenine-methyltransferase [Tautonia sp. JC769]|uniref:DNA N-6-adenine-methyltransferase n=1 Tax=Tautonia sp. JC769 TaxID=3232135 RepID=UPI0034587655